MTTRSGTPLLADTEQNRCRNERSRPSLKPVSLRTKSGLDVQGIDRDQGSRPRATKLHTGQTAIFDSPAY